MNGAAFAASGIHSNVRIRSFLLIAWTMLVSCVPLNASYLRVDAPEAVYYRGYCRGIGGPPTLAYFPFHEVFISLDLTSYWLGIHVPAGVTAQLDETTLELSGTTNGGPVDTTVLLQATDRGARGSSDPPDFLALPDPYVSNNQFGPLRGGSQGSHHLYYLFHSVDRTNPRRSVSPPQDFIRGSIRLPSITINGRSFEGLTLPIERRHYTGIDPINC